MTELRVLGLIRPYLPRILLAALVSAAAELSGIALIATAAWLLATAASQPPLTALTVAIVGVRTFAISRGGLRYLDRLVGHDAVLRALAGLRSTVFAALTPLAPAGNRMFRSGDLLTRLVSDVDSIQDLVLRVWTPIGTAIVVCLAAIGFTATHSVAAAGVLAAGLAIAGVVLPWTAGRIAVRASARRAAAASEFAAATVDLTVGAADLAAYGGTESARSRARRYADSVAAAERRGTAIDAAVTAAGSLLAGGTVIGVFGTAGDLGVMTAVLALTALVCFESVAGLPAAIRRLAEIRTATGRLTELLDAIPPVPEPERPQAIPDDSHLVLRDVRPAIPGRSAEGPGIDLDLPPGHRVAIRGPSGAGKTMLLNSLVRFTGMARGTVTLGGVDLTRLRGDDVRTVIGGMLSDSHLFDDTVRANLLLGKPSATDDELTAVLERTGMPDLELSTMVGRDGGRISGGQRQRLLLARALLADFPILLLDEPTEHLDPETADAVLTDLLAATRGHTVILVTHHPAALDAFDHHVTLPA